MPKLLLIKKSNEVLYEIYTTSCKDCPASWSGHFYTTGSVSNHSGNGSENVRGPTAILGKISVRKTI